MADRIGSSYDSSSQKTSNNARSEGGILEGEVVPPKIVPVKDASPKDKNKGFAGHTAWSPVPQTGKHQTQTHDVSTSEVNSAKYPDESHDAQYSTRTIATVSFDLHRSRNETPRVYRFSGTGFAIDSSFFQLPRHGLQNSSYQVGAVGYDSNWWTWDVPEQSPFGDICVECGRVQCSCQTSSCHRRTFLSLEEDVEHLDPVSGSGAIRSPSDLPTISDARFQYGHVNNTVGIRSGPSTCRNPGNERHLRSMPQRPPLRIGRVESDEFRRFLLELDLSKEKDRLASFTFGPIKGLTAVRFAKAGFFYLGDGDRVQCFSCGGVLKDWAPQNDPEVEHKHCLPKCKFVRGEDPRNVPLSHTVTTDNQEEMRNRWKYADCVMNNSIPVENALAMGCFELNVKIVVLDNFDHGNEEYETTNDIVYDLMNIAEEGRGIPHS